MQTTTSGGVSGQAQIGEALVVPRLVRFTGVVTSADGSPRTGLVGMTFALYKDQEGGAPLWQEVQNVQLDNNGRYSILLGATKAEGLPLDLFTSNEARWLGVQVETDPEQPRLLLVSVPYALKASDAETLGGKPASAFVTVDQVAGTSAGSGSGSVAVGSLRTSGAAIVTSAANVTTSGGTQNFVAKFDATGTNLINSSMFDDGNVGLGTASPFSGLSWPSPGLEISGSRGVLGVTTTTTGGLATLRFKGPSAGSEFHWNFTDGTNPDLSLFSYALGGYMFTLKGNGNVGIGTTSPFSGLSWSSPGLEVSGSRGVLGVTTTTTGGLATLRFKGPTAGSEFHWNLTDGPNPDLTLFSYGGGGYMFTLKGNGNVGIGTTTPGAKLEVAGNLKISGGGNGLIFPDNTTQFTAATGTISGVTAGSGLAGGGTSGNVTLSVTPSGITNAMLANNSVTVNPGSGLQGGGAISLGGSGSLSLLTSCSAGQLLKWNGSAWACDTDLTTSGTFSGGPTVFSGSNGTQIVGITQSGPGAALQAQNSDNADGAVAVLGNVSSTTNNTVGIWGQNASASGIAVRGDSSAPTGTTIGVLGTSSSPSGTGVEGDANLFGVHGTAASTTGAGVQGDASAATGNTFGVRGITLSATGTGVSGEASGNGATVGVHGVVNSTAGIAGVFENIGGGDILIGKQGPNQVFLVDANGGVTADSFSTPGPNPVFQVDPGGNVTAAGNVSATGSVTANSFTSLTALSTPAISATTVSGANAATFSGSNASQIAAVTQTGSGVGLVVSDGSSSDTVAAILAQATSTTGQTLGLYATNKSVAGIAVRGDSTATSGSTIGVQGTSLFNPNGTGVEGDANAFGVHGNAAGATGVGVQGDASSPTGSTFGVRGITLSATGTGVSGEASASGPTAGATVGVHGVVNSPLGIAGVFENNGGGDLLVARQGGSVVFRVDKNGSVTANNFSGTASFSGGMTATNISTSDGAAAILAQASGLTGNTVGIWGQNASVSGIAVRGDSSAGTGSTIGVLGTTASSAGVGVSGVASAGSGFSVGVYGVNKSTDGTAVEGDATATTGSTVAVYGSNVSTGGTAIKGDAKATSGNTVGIYGTNSSDAGIGMRGDALASSGFTLGMYGTTVSSSGTGVKGEATSGSGSTFGTYGLSWSTSGVGVQGEANSASGKTIGVHGIVASTTGTGVQGDAPAIGVLGNGSGSTAIGVKGTVSSSSGTAAVFDNSGGGNIVIGQVSGVNKFRVNGSGRGFFNGGTQNSGADFAESVDVLGHAADYEPGDVMIIDATGRRRMALARQPYSTLVAGIYSTKPGVLATPHGMDDPRLAGEVPLAIVGIVPCKVSAENGPIQSGDLLVTSATPGYAMKGTDHSRMLGAVVGKALGSLASGKGVIEVLVTLQ